MLLFKKKFLPAIRAGEKTQTVRLWKHRMMRSGQRSYIPGAGYVRVESVDSVRLDELTDGDARPDGFETADLLRAELDAIYGDKLKSGYQAFRVRFRLIGSDESGLSS
ncbi:MAG: ASCH domain-containing protein [Planctomycetota bacterium]